MRKEPLVSVITIFFNSEKFIQEAVESVFAQTYYNWELILVDDGSTDESTQIVKRYASMHLGKVRYFEHDGRKNLGMSASRNLGIRNSNGRYIAFLDSDDVWFPKKLKEQVSILESTPNAGMIYGTSQYWHSWTGNPEDLGRDFISKLPLEPDTLVEPPKLALVSYPLGKGFAPCPSDLLVRREVFDRVGVFEEEFRGMYEDQAFLAKIYLKEHVYLSNECWDRYRIHPNSCVAVSKEEGQYDQARISFLKWLERYLITEGLKGTEVWKALQDGLKPYEKHSSSFVASNFGSIVTKLKDGVISYLRKIVPNI